MKRKLTRRSGPVPIRTVFQQSFRPKFNLSTVAAVFRHFEERNSQAQLLFEAFSPELLEARLSSVKHLQLRLQQLGLDHRIDFADALRPNRYEIPPLLEKTRSKNIRNTSSSFGRSGSRQTEEEVSSSGSSSSTRKNRRYRDKRLQKDTSFTSKVRAGHTGSISVRGNKSNG